MGKWINPLMRDKPVLYGREDVPKDNSWKPMYFRSEEYLFNMSVRDRLDKVLVWAATQIGSFLKGILQEFGEGGLAKVARALYLKRKEEAETMLAKGEFKNEYKNARSLGSLVMEWDCCMGILSEVVENTDERMHVRIYHCPVGEYFGRKECIATHAEGQGLIEGLSGGAFTLKPGPCFFSDGDPYCEWVIERTTD